MSIFQLLEVFFPLLPFILVCTNKVFLVWNIWHEWHEVVNYRKDCYCILAFESDVAVIPRKILFIHVSTPRDQSVILPKIVS